MSRAGLKQENRKQVVASVVKKGDLVALLSKRFRCCCVCARSRRTRTRHAFADGSRCRGIDELTVEASVRQLHVLDAPTVTSGGEVEEADEGDEGDEEIIDAPDESAEGEAEAQAEARPEAGMAPPTTQPACRGRRRRRQGRERCRRPAHCGAGTMSATETRDRYAVIGNPVGHSKSPFIARPLAPRRPASRSNTGTCSHRWTHSCHTCARSSKRAGAA